MLTSHIGAVLKQALTTFSCKSEIFYQNLEILKALLDKTTPEDVNLHPQFKTDALWQNRNKAPVTYIDIYEDYCVTLGIFILKPGMKLPLHNHPQMYGLIKVLFGKIKITSYSVTKASPNARFLTAEKYPIDELNAQCNCCLLEPEKRNLHEIESVGGPAAFIDILSPPYDTVSADGVRNCRYYGVLRELQPGVVQLNEISSPSWYWSDSYPYTGPNLSD